MLGMHPLNALFGAAQRRQTSADLIAYAAALAGQGLHVLLCTPGTKVPWDELRTPAQRKAEPRGGVYAATATRATLRATITRAYKALGEDLKAEPAVTVSAFPNLAVNVGTSRAIVVDVDTADELAAFQTWAASMDANWRDRWHKVRPTVSTPGVVEADGTWRHKDGGHFWFTLPEGTDLPEGLPADIRVPVGDSGFVVMLHSRYVLIPPSERPEGAYRVTGPALEAPAWLLAWLQGEAAQRAAATVDREAARAARSVDPARTDAVTDWEGGTAWAHLLDPHGWAETGADSTCGCAIWGRPGGASPKSATAHHECRGHGTRLQVWSSGVPELPPGSFSMVEVSAALDHAGDVSAALTAAGSPPVAKAPTMFGVMDRVPEPVAAVNAAPAADAVDAATWPEGHPADPALMVSIFGHSEVTRALWHHARRQAVYTAPVALLLAELARVGAAAGPQVVTGTDDPLSTFLAVVGPSGAGKSAALSPRRSPWAGGMAVAGAPAPLTVAGVASGQAIIDGLTEAGEGGTRQMRAHPVLVIREDELTGLVAKARGATATLSPTLLAGWSGEDIGDLSRTHGTRTTTGPYSLFLLGGIQPALAGPLVSGEAAASGLAQRLIFTATDDPRADEDHGIPQPSTVPAIPAPDTSRRAVGLPPAAWEAQTAQRRRAATWATADHALDAHALRVRIRLATLAALLHGEREVTPEVWEWSEHLMEHHRRSRAATVAAADDARMADAARIGEERAHGQAAGAASVADDVGQTAAKLLTMLTMLPAAGEGVLRSALRRKLTERMRPSIDPALAELVRTGKVRVSDADGLAVVQRI